MHAELRLGQGLCPRAAARAGLALGASWRHGTFSVTKETGRQQATHRPFTWWLDTRERLLDVSERKYRGGGKLIGHFEPLEPVSEKRKGDTWKGNTGEPRVVVGCLPAQVWHWSPFPYSHGSFMLPSVS